MTSTHHVMPLAPRRVELRSTIASLVASPAFIFLMLVLVVPIFNSRTQPFTGTATLTGDGNPARQISYLLVFGFMLWTFRGAHQSRFSVVPASIIILLAWCCLSLSWALDPDIAMRRLILTGVVIWTIYLMVHRDGVDRTLAIIRVAMVAVLIANFAAVAFWPQTGVTQALEIGGDTDIIGTWQGILLQKNWAGAFCAVTIIFFTFDARSVGPKLRIPIILLASCFLLFTRSKTSIGLLLFSVGVGFLFSKYNPRNRVAVGIALGVSLALAGLAFATYFDQIVSPFSSENAFTGRGTIWRITLGYFSDHWLGAGFGSFWNIGEQSPVYHYTNQKWATEIANGHNGYFDLLAEIGLPGVVLTLFAMVFLPIGKLIASMQIHRQRGALLMASLVFCATQNFTESSVLDRDMIVEVLFVFTIAMITRATQPALRSKYEARAYPRPAYQYVARDHRSAARSVAR